MIDFGWDILTDKIAVHQQPPNHVLLHVVFHVIFFYLFLYL